MAGCDAIERDWSAWIPLEIVKAQKGQMRIGGVATDEEAEDLQGEKVFIDGLDISYLLQRGAFNWDHGKDPGDILGEVDSAQKQGKRLYVEGLLYPKVKKAQEVYDLMSSLKESGSKRKLGLSVEGKVKERDVENGKHIRKAWIKNIAVTYNPINKGTWVDMIKSLGVFDFEPCPNDYEKCTLCEADFDKSEDSSEGGKKVVEGKPLESTVGTTVLEEKPEKKDTLKSSSSSPDNQAKGPGENTKSPPLEESKEEVEKAGPPVGGGKGLKVGYDIPATSGGVSGSALREEDLEKKPKIVTYEEKHLGIKPIKVKRKRKKIGEFTKSELIEWFEDERGYSPKMAGVMADLIFKAVEIHGYIRTRRGHLERVKPYTKELSHELHRVGTMSERALMTRATKITRPSKILHFWNIAKDRGMYDLAAVIKHEGKRRLGLRDSDFEDVRREMKYAAAA